MEGGFHAKISSVVAHQKGGFVPKELTLEVN